MQLNQLKRQQEFIIKEAIIYDRRDMAFKIKNLKCSYNKRDTVLHVPELAIETGEIMFILGKSGYGKSTLLETLALMNNTFMDGEVTYYPSGSGGIDSYNIKDIWKNFNDDQLAHLRAEHFSFIFQQTNLMPNFSAYQNVYVSMMLQGYPEERCIEKTHEVLGRIGLSVIEQHENVSKMSGGQRQRLAFARAIISKYDVLFGDEPTGNLDECNANELMKILSEHIRKPDNGNAQTAIMVTHNIEIAVKYADSVVIITNGEDNKCGFIEPQSKFTRKNTDLGTVWSNGIDSYKEEGYKKYIKEKFYLS